VARANDAGGGRAPDGRVDVDQDLAAERQEVRGPVAVRPEEDLAPLGALELLVRADAVDRSQQEVPGDAARRTSNRAPPPGRSSTAISPWCESTISFAM